MNKKPYSVRQINEYIKGILTQDYLLKNVLVEGEVSNCKYNASGHIYFTLKDMYSSIGAVMFAGYRRGLKTDLKDGMKVVVTGKIDVYETSGRYQLYAFEIEKAGEGDLYLRFEQLKKELALSGMFDKRYKKPIPKYSMRVGIVTSDTGAAIEDIKNIAARRNSHVQLILCPAVVQGDNAPESIVNAIETLDSYGPDVIIVGRGGGSIEELWAFNDVRVANAIFSATTPIISAVGHEIDYTIADFVADLRAPTPSAAAEIAVFDENEFGLLLDKINERLNGITALKIERLEREINRLFLKLKMNHPASKLLLKEKELENRYAFLQRLIEKNFEKAFKSLQIKTAKLDGLSPLKKLTGGFGAISKDGRPIGSINQVEKDDLITVTLNDGKIESRVTKKEAISI